MEWAEQKTSDEAGSGTQGREADDEEARHREADDEETRDREAGSGTQGREADDEETRDREAGSGREADDEETRDREAFHSKARHQKACNCEALYEEASLLSVLVTTGVSEASSKDDERPGGFNRNL